MHQNINVTHKNANDGFMKNAQLKQDDVPSVWSGGEGGGGGGGWLISPKQDVNDPQDWRLVRPESITNQLWLCMN